MLTISTLLLVVLSGNILAVADYGQSAAKVMVLNTVADRLIERLTKKLKAKGTNIVPLPDTEKNDHGLISQGLIAKQGTFSDLATIKRAGDISITINDNTITVKLAVGIGKAMVHFQDFQAWYGAISLSDELNVYINRISAMLQLTLTVYEDSFKVSVDKCVLQEFGDVILERRKEGEMQSISNNFLTWILSWFEDKIKKTIETAIKGAIEKGLKKHKLL